MKKSFLLVPLAIILVMSLFLVSCEDEPEIKTYTVTFLLDEGDAEPFDKKTVLEGAGITDAKVPEKTGHKFLNWKTIGGNDAYELNTPVKGDLTLVAVWDINTYTVTFYNEDGTSIYSTTSANHGQQFSSVVQPTPEKTGHVLIGWATEKGSTTAYDSSKAIEGNMNLYPIWEKGQYKVSFICGEGAENGPQAQAVEFEGKAREPENIPTKTGYTFRYWATSADSKSGYDFATPITNNLVLYPVFEINEYTVTFIGDEHISSVPDTQKVAYGNYAEDPNAKAKNGYIFNGWKTEGSEEYFDFETKITSDITLQAVISRDTTKAHVSFFDGEKLVASGYYIIGSTQEFPIYNNVGTGCTLKKWVLESNPEKEYLPGGDFTPVDYKTEYKFYAYITTDLLSIDKNGSVKATNTLKTSNITPLSIPYSINGIKVTAIADNAFYNCTKLKEITIPDSVTSIGQYAFAYSGLTGITIPSSVTSIEKEAFRDCKNLKGLSFSGTNYVEIGYAAFKGCSGLISIDFGNRYTTLGNDAFADCTSLTSVILKGSFTGQNHFKGCTALESVEIKEGVTAIGDYMFQGCTSLNSVSLPNSLKIIYRRVFEGCSDLQSITLPNSVESIYYNAFASTGLTSITIPSSVTTIGVDAFKNCANLSEINIQKTEGDITGAPWGAPNSTKVTWVSAN